MTDPNKMQQNVSNIDFGDVARKSSKIAENPVSSSIQLFKEKYSDKKTSYDAILQTIQDKLNENNEDEEYKKLHDEEISRLNNLCQSMKLESKSPEEKWTTRMVCIDVLKSLNLSIAGFEKLIEFCQKINKNIQSVNDNRDKETRDNELLNYSPSLAEIFHFYNYIYPRAQITFDGMSQSHEGNNFNDIVNHLLSIRINTLFEDQFGKISTISNAELDMRFGRKTAKEIFDQLNIELKQDKNGRIMSFLHIAFLHTTSHLNNQHSIFAGYQELWNRKYQNLSKLDADNIAKTIIDRIMLTVKDIQKAIQNLKDIHRIASMDIENLLF